MSYRLITNLDYKVTDEDVQELFENCGAIKKAGVLYDRRYSSACTAQYFCLYKIPQPNS